MRIRQRPRRLRKDASIRALVRENHVDASDLIQPLFVIDGTGKTEAIDSMPGVERLTIDKICERGQGLLELGIRAVALFPCVESSLKDADGSEALNPKNLVIRTILALKSSCPELSVIADVALDPYTTHGHDGILNPEGTRVMNDRTVETLAVMARILAEAGVDWVAPSDMMDGRIGAIRDGLDDAGLVNTSILSYAVKYASAYYGPFRDAVGSARSAGTRLLDKSTYQMDPANRREAIREALLDVEQGADALMVKPAGPYLDIIREVRDATLLPLAAYQVSGEYAQIHAAAKMGWLDLIKTRDESLLAIKRAGADMILTYFAESYASGLSQTG